MLTLSAINKDHKKLLESMINDLDRLVYDATEHYTSQKFTDYQPVKFAIYNLYNEAFESYEQGQFEREEMLYMLPNLLLFSFAGFAAGLQNKHNRLLIEELHEEAATLFARYVGSITDLIKEECLE
tara:strand:- start:1318 stop:1695 length:378 start_codon:yes stop_codon:yes gene_type:complete